MGHSFTHPASAALMERVAHQLTADDLFLVPDHHLLFVCGGPIDGTKTYCREIFWDFLRTEPNKRYRVFLAEDAARDVVDHGKPTFLDLNEFEGFLASIADCIILFTESPGSMAELGFFSAYRDVAEKCLVVVDTKYQGDDSFINNGPINTIATVSRYKPCLYVPMNDRDYLCQTVIKRLRRFNRTNREKFTTNDFSKMSNKEQLAMLLELICLFRAISFAELTHIVDAIFRFSQPDRVKLHVSLLLSSRYVKRPDNHDDILVPSGNHRMVSLSKVQPHRISIDIADYYRRHAPDRYAYISGL